MGKFEDLTGLRFNKLIVINRLLNERGKTVWDCLCDCGKSRKVQAHNLKNGHIKSCGCSRRKDLTNKQFGRLTVLKRVQYHNTNKTWWECICLCGRHTNAATHTLISGHKKSCGCLDRDTKKILKRSILDKRFGKLVVLERTKSDKSRGSVYICKCDCGNYANVGLNNLTTGKTQSCGCLKTFEDRKEAAFFNLYRRYRSSAKSRNIEFLLTQEQMRNLIDKNCCFCNEPPKNIIYNSLKDNFILYNGIDRINSSLGYTVDNCDTCCEVCNRAKSKRDKKEFIEWIKKVSNNIENKNA